MVDVITKLERELADLKLRVQRIEERHSRLDEGLREMLREDQKTTPNVAELLGALVELRKLVVEHPGVPKYTITPGAALSSVIDDIVDPAIARGRRAPELKSEDGVEHIHR